MIEATDLTARMMAAIEADHQPPMPSLETPEAMVLRVRAATQALDWTLAEMPPHQLEHVARYLRWALNQEPVKSNPLCEPQRIVLGLLMLALRDVLKEWDGDPALDYLTAGWFAA
jgi:hypothetical protein